jgi:hypothetical protein
MKIKLLLQYYRKLSYNGLYITDHFTLARFWDISVSA